MYSQKLVFYDCKSSGALQLEVFEEQVEAGRVNDVIPESSC